MKKLSDHPQFVEINGALQRAQAELRTVKKRKSEVDQALLNFKLKQPAERAREWDQYRTGGDEEQLGELERREEPTRGIRFPRGASRIYCQGD